jgi:SAM-dependent methyltransferase
MGFHCLVCEHDSCRFVLNKDSLILSRCGRCGFIQRDPLPDRVEYEAIYEDTDSYCEELLRGEDIFKRRDADVLEDLATSGATGPLLDVGAGAGILLAAAKDRGWDAVGLELARPAAEHIRAEIGTTVHEQPIERAPLEANSFGVVTLSHSLEHVLDPAETLRKAAAVLRPGGFVHIAVPNWKSAKRLAAGIRIPWIFPEHISYFTRKSLGDLLSRSGFEPIRWQNLPMACDVDYRFGLVMAERLRLHFPIRRFLHMGERQLDELLTDNVEVSCPPWRLRLVDRLTRLFLKVWPERLFCMIGRGEELRVTAKLRG